MLSWIREKMGTAVIGSIIAFIAFVFVFYGVFSPKATRGLHEAAVAGTVGGDSIAMSELNRAVQRRIEIFKAYSDQPLTDAQVKKMGLRDMVFQDLVVKRAMIQVAAANGVVSADGEVRDQIQAMPDFQKDGRFDLDTYRRLLEANGFTPARYEGLMREDLAAQYWENYFSERVRLSERELQKYALLAAEKRALRYVVLSTEGAKKKLVITPAGRQAFEAEPTQQNKIQMKFQDGQSTVYQGKKLEEVKEEIVRTLIEESMEQKFRESNGKTADQLVELLTAAQQAAGKSKPKAAADDLPGQLPEVKKLNTFLQSQELKVASTGLFAAQSFRVPGIGEAPEILADIFKKNRDLDGKAKKYVLADRIVVAVLIEKESQPQTATSPVLAGLERAKLVKLWTKKKSNFVRDEWKKDLRNQVVVERNEAVIHPERD